MLRPCSAAFAGLRRRNSMEATVKHRPPNPLAVSPAEAAQMLGLGRTKFYELLASNEITSVKIGSRRLIRVSVLEDWLADKDRQYG